MADIRPADEDAFRLTTCYAAGRCQGDLACPGDPRFPAGCYRIPDDSGEDDDDW